MKARLFLSVLLVFVAPVMPAQASIEAGGQWDDNGPSLSWNVTGPVGGFYTYDYTWEYDEDPALSHLIIEITPFPNVDEDYRNFMMWDWDLGDFVTTGFDVEIQNFLSTNPSNPGMPGDMWGIKFQDFEDLISDDGEVWMKFESRNSPVPGDFHAKGGTSSFAYNDGFTGPVDSDVSSIGNSGSLPDNNDPQHIMRPNGEFIPPPIPEPSSVLIFAGLMGLAFVRRPFWSTRRR